MNITPRNCDWCWLGAGVRIESGIPNLSWRRPLSTGLDSPWRGAIAPAWVPDANIQVLSANIHELKASLRGFFQGQRGHHDTISLAQIDDNRRGCTVAPSKEAASKGHCR